MFDQACDSVSNQETINIIAELSGCGNLFDEPGVLRLDPSTDYAAAEKCWEDVWVSICKVCCRSKDDLSKLEEKIDKINSGESNVYNRGRAIDLESAIAAFNEKWDNLEDECVAVDAEFL